MMNQKGHDTAFSLPAEVTVERDAFRDPEEELRRCRLELTALEREVIRVSEEERGRFAVELHDSTCQELIAIGFVVTGIQRRLEKEGNPLAANLQAVAKAISETAAHTRQIAHGLSPSVTDGDELMGALRALSAATSEQYGLSCCFECSPQVAIPNSDVSHHLYRIAQEAILNAARHSQATRIDVTLSQTDAEICLVVADDGCGLFADVERGTGFGLRGMKCRAELIRGHLTIQRGSRGGTKVICRVRASQGEETQQN